MANIFKDKFTANLKRALAAAAEVARELGQNKIFPEHLLYGLTLYRGSLSSEILNKFKITPEPIKQLLTEKYTAPSNATNTEIKLTPEAKKIIQKAVLIAGVYRHKYVGSEHLLAALIELATPSLKILLAKNNINPANLQQQLQVVLRSTSRFSDLTASLENHPGNNTGNLPPGLPEEMEKMLGLGGNNNAANVLELFTSELTDENAQQKIDPVIGREAEIERVIQVLSRRTKNNPVLLGDPGVGKTAIVEGLAKKILHGEVPEILLDKKILTLDLGLMLAGTMYRGEFEQRLKNLVSEIKKDQDIILFIDELHTLTGAGAAPGSLDAANILKPALARGEIRCIGATTPEEYRKHIEADAALERRFQPILVKEPSAEKAIEILTGIKKNYEQFHRVEITADAIETAVRLSSRYLPDRFLPDKAIDLIDEASAKLRVAASSEGLRQKIKKIERGLGLLAKNKRQAILGEKYAEALDYQEQERAAKIELTETESLWQKKQKKILGAITGHDIATLISKMTGIPLTELVEVEKDKILNLEKRLSQKIIGQTEAIKELALAIRRSRTGIALAKRPIGSFIFLGPSGVGKTELAKVLAKELFENDSALIKIDMSEYKESFNVSKLIGSPPGYVGYKESGQLTEAVRRQPYSVVLFDEIEKAHPEIFNILLQVMEDGELTDATGKKINFRNTIIIMTSNVGLKDFVQNKKIGFNDLTANRDLYEEMKGYLEKSLTEQFRPEFINRLDKIIVFKPLNSQELANIAKLQLDDLNERLKTKKIKLQFGPKVTEFLAAKDFNAEQGARLIRKNIQELVENPIAELLLKPKSQKNAIIKLQIKGKELILA